MYSDDRSPLAAEMASEKMHISAVVALLKTCCIKHEGC